MTDQPNAQQKVDLFVRLLPLSMHIAGLPVAEHGKYYNDDQMELRAIAVKKAFKFAKQIVRDIAAEESPKT